VLVLVLYLVTATPVDVGLRAGHNLCVAVDPSSSDGIWWWDPGSTGCSSRSSSIMRAEHPSITAKTSSTFEVHFRVGLISRPPGSDLEVSLVIESDKVRGANGSSVSVLRRADLDIPMAPACCRLQIQ
jgi:hypothetical protein